MCHRNCVQATHFYPDDSASPKVISAPSTPLLLATGTNTHTHTHSLIGLNYVITVTSNSFFADGHEPLTVKQFVKHVMELHSANTFSKEFEVCY